MRKTMLIAGIALAILCTVSTNAFAKKKEPKKMDGSKDKIVTTASGLKYVDIKPGTGAQPKTGQMCTMNYTGWLESNNKVFDSNIDPKFGHVTPFTFAIGQHQVIAGWDEGVGSMKVGGKRKLIIPPALGYGARDVGNGLIPANSTLVFEVELVGVK